MSEPKLVKCLNKTGSPIDFEYAGTRYSLPPGEFMAIALSAQYRLAPATFQIVHDEPAPPSIPLVVGPASTIAAAAEIGVRTADQKPVLPEPLKCSHKGCKLEGPAGEIPNGDKPPRKVVICPKHGAVEPKKEKKRTTPRRREK